MVEISFSPCRNRWGRWCRSKLRIAEDGSRFLLSIGIKPKLGVLSGGRPQDKGRSKKIDESIEDGELLTSMLLEKLIEVKHYFILIEDAIADGSNFIITPDGISGNLIFRSLVLLGGGKSWCSYPWNGWNICWHITIPWCGRV